MPLFPDPPQTIEPALDQPNPVVWIRRLLVVSSLAPTVEPNRDVSFRLGLNIIRTADRPPGETLVIGHSVGKTLLTRLIRYCLGETHLAVEPVRQRIAGLLPNAYVVAVVNVEGMMWGVVRPLHDSHTTASWAMPGEDWRAVKRTARLVPKGKHNTSSERQNLDGVLRFVGQISDGIAP